MCDYSLHSIENRLAEQGDQLVVHRFRTGSMGLAAQHIEDTSPQSLWKQFFSGGDAGRCAVCIPPGARLRMTGISPALQQKYGLAEVEEATFTQMSAETRTYRDAVRFRNDTVLLLQGARPGDPGGGAGAVSRRGAAADGAPGLRASLSAG